MYAIIETGGKQYRVEKNDVIDVELLEADDAKKIELSTVLFVFDGTKATVGTPYVSKSAVRAELIDEVKGPKVLSMKYKKRKNYRRKVGHRQRYARIKITEITL